MSGLLNGDSGTVLTVLGRDESGKTGGVALLLKKRPPLALLHDLHMLCRLSGAHMSPPLTRGTMWSTVCAGRWQRTHDHPSLSRIVMRSFFHLPVPIALLLNAIPLTCNDLKLYT